MQRNLTVGAVIIALTLLVFGVTRAEAQGADDPALVEAGKGIFESNCAGCHGVDGTGSSRGRPLIGVATENDISRHIMSVTEGRGNMPSFADILTGDEIEAAVTYARVTFVEPPAPETTSDDSSDDAAADDAAASSDDTSAQPELAVTGAETPMLALGGATLLVAGVMLVGYGRRNDVP